MAKYIQMVIGILLLAFSFAVNTTATQEPASPSPVPTPQELWERFQNKMGPLQYKVLQDKVIPSETDPGTRLRRIDFEFSSQVVPYEEAGSGETVWRLKKLWHRGTIFIPTDPQVVKQPGRFEKVVIVGSLVGSYLQSFISNYGDPIAVRLGYPTMVLPNPGELEGFPGQMYSQRMLINYRKEHDDLTNHSHFRWAVPFLRALDIMAEILDVDKDKIRAVIGGHSKRATSAFTAAAMDSKRIAGVVFMGNESLHPEGPESHWWPVSPYYSQRFVRCPILYVGSTNESGYAMFNINRIQAQMRAPWTIEMIPNYWHASESEIQFLNWRMWVSHVFDGRPTTTISDLSYELKEKGTKFNARIDSPNRLILTHIWYTRVSTSSSRRDLVWYPTLMKKKQGNLYEGFVTGEIPDIWFVEVQDTAQGFRGYVSSLPQDLTGISGRSPEHIPK